MQPTARTEASHVRLFAGFTSSSAFRYSVIFIVRLKSFRTTRPSLGMSLFLSWSFRDCGCGKAMSFDDSFGYHRRAPQVRTRTCDAGSASVRTMSNITHSKKQREELLRALQARFEQNMNRHKGLEWEKVQAKLEANAEKLWSLNEMEKT